MADQPQSPNSGRISAMLNDLAQQRSGAPSTPQAPAGGPPPSNLPVARPTVPQTVPTAPRPATPPPLVPPATPMAPRPPAGAVMPPKIQPPPAPRELPIISPPKPTAPPAPPAPPPPSAPKPPVPPKREAPSASGQPLTSELRTMSGDIGQIQVGQPPAGIRPAIPVTPPAPGTPAVPKAATPAPGPSIAVPPPKSGKRKWVFVGLGLMILIVLAAIISSLMGRNGTDSTPTPTPSSSASLAPQTRNLNSYFSNPASTITLQQATAREDLRNALLTAQPLAGQAKRLAVQLDSTALTPASFLDVTLGGVPAGLTSSLGSDMAALAFGQTELYDAAGQAITGGSAQTRLALVMEITDASAANQAMTTWENSGLASAGEDIFRYRFADRIVSGFSTGTYRQIPVRYWNFPYADKSLDWAMVLAANGKNYLVLSGSRESAFFAIDQLMQ